MHRRRFLEWLAASPLLAQDSDPISKPEEAINVLEFEAAAKKALPPAHFGYMATGVDADATLRANREGFSKVQLRPRRLVDVRTLDTTATLFGSKLDHPIVLAPVGNQGAFQPQGELLAARAAGAKKTQVILSTMTNSRIEDVAKAADRPIWYQLYATNRWEVTQHLLQRAENAGCPVVALTVDTNSGRRTDTLELSKRFDKRPCASCHPEGQFLRRKAMFEGIDHKGLSTGNPGMDWKFVEKLRGATKMKVLVKGLEVGEDARLACESGADGIIVSNHGARATETGRGTIECLPEVVDAVRGRVPVLIDGGFRRGTDIFKALALGASAVCVGRPYIWGLAAFGQPGVERVIDILRAEFELVMRQCGTRNLAAITREYVKL
ncbi:MAG: alpha-hydroxy acid oxidase [Bryobacteraceae bacterium]|nr:alpha-hydroxy acid oxidase [Bryobacteraceae bacterium]